MQAVWGLGYLAGAATHVADLMLGGAEVYAALPAGVRVFWASLTLVNPLTAVLLLMRRRLGVVLGVVVILVDLAVNWIVFAMAEGLSPFGLINLTPVRRGAARLRAPAVDVVLRSVACWRLSPSSQQEPRFPCAGDAPNKHRVARRDHLRGHVGVIGPRPLAAGHRPVPQQQRWIVARHEVLRAESITDGRTIEAVEAQRHAPVRADGRGRRLPHTSNPCR